jgi:ELWxxDGT repeat protein
MPLINLPHLASNRSHVRRASIILIAVLLLVVQRPSHPVRAANAPVLVKDINTGASTTVLEGVHPQNLVAVGNRLYFSAYSESSGVELWASDGTESGTRLVKDIFPGSDGSIFSFSFVDFNGTLFFAANDGTHGTELWRSDGTAEGTVRLSDIASGAASSTPYAFALSGDHVFFGATDSSAGIELWAMPLTLLNPALFKYSLYLPLAAT